MKMIKVIIIIIMVRRLRSRIVRFSIRGAPTTYSTNRTSSCKITISKVTNKSLMMTLEMLINKNK